MDNETENLPEEVKISIKTSDLADTEENNEPPVVIKKSGAAMLSLMMSLLALIVSGYLFYQNHSSIKNSSGQQEITQLNQKLYQANQTLSADLASAQLTIKDNQKLLQNLVDQMAELQANENSATIFDNTENLALIEQLHQQLDQQKNRIEQLLVENSDSTTVLPTVDQDSLQRQATLNQLRMVQMMLNNNQLPQAIRTLENHLTADQLKPTIQLKLKQLLLDLKGIKQVDKKALFNELDQIQRMVVALSLETEAEENNDSSWYDKLISVKKINSDNSLANSTELAILKADLAQHLIQAKIALSLADQDNWQLQLKTAATKVSTQLPSQAGMRQKLLLLAEQSVVPDLQEAINFQAIINELTRIN